MMKTMATSHISEAEAHRDFAGLLHRVRSGEEIVIERDDATPVMLRAAETPHLRLLSDSLRMARERRSTATLDGGFAADLEAAIASHPEPLSAVEWD